jgi:hypothetical protein
VEHKEVLSITTELIDLSVKNDMELLKMERNAKANVSKYEKMRIPDLKKRVNASRDQKTKQKAQAQLKAAFEKLDEHRGIMQASRNEINKRNGGTEKV